MKNYLNIIILFIVVTTLSYLITCKWSTIENFGDGLYRHLYGHFGGIPNESQIWGEQIRTIF